MKKTQILLLTIILSCTTTKEFVDFKYNDEELTPFQSKTKWGFVDKNLHVYIKPKYDSVGFFYNGIAKIKIDGKYGLIRKDKYYLIKPKYSKVEEFYNNYSQITKKKQSKCIDSKGEVLTHSPLQTGYCFGTIKSIYKGVTTKVDGKYELVLEKMKKTDSATTIIYDTTNLKADTILDFSNDYIQVVKNGKIGITKFNQPSPKKTTIKEEDLKYDSIVVAKYYFGATKYAKVQIGNMWGIINEQGYETVKIKYLSILTDPIEIRNPIAIINKRIYLNHKKLLVEFGENKFGYIDLNGNEYFKR